MVLGTASLCLLQFVLASEAQALLGDRAAIFDNLVVASVASQSVELASPLSCGGGEAAGKRI